MTMIAKIFYSLVLFPFIKYDFKIAHWFYLTKINEIWVWIFELCFQNIEWHVIYVYFKHKYFLNGYEKPNLNNWYVYWNDILVREIINKLYDKDKTRDFNFYDNKELNKTKPFGVVLSITKKCNLSCYYCFNDSDYSLKNRNKYKDNWLEFWTWIIDELYNNWTRVIIITWWEPILVSFFWELLDYIKNKNIFVHLNTNWTLLSDNFLIKLNKEYSINIMVSMHEFNYLDFYNANHKWLTKNLWNNVKDNYKKIFSDKILQLKKLKFFRNISLEFLTILNWKNILNLDKIYEFGKISWINFNNWQFFRLYSTINNKWASISMMNLAIKRIYLLNKKFWVNYKIVDPVPFCVCNDPNISKIIIDWVLSDTHDVKTIITHDWDIQLMSSYDSNLWNIKNISIKEVFSTDFVKKSLNNWFLPKECIDCKFKDECKGWSRMDAHLVYWSYSSPDPISIFNNKIII